MGIGTNHIRLEPVNEPKKDIKLNVDSYSVLSARVELFRFDQWAALPILAASRI